MSRSLIVGLLLFLSLTLVASALERIYVKDDFLYDQSGRVNIFHGINSVNKGEPYYSDLSDEQIDELAYTLGMNVVRLGFSWEGFERERDVYDDNYLVETEKLIARFAERGIYTIIDVHQDLWTRKYCGNGMSSWTAIIDPDVERSSPFPIPVLGDVVYEFDPITGNIKGSECARTYWGQYYFANITTSIFESFYNNVQEIQTQFAIMWKIIANRFVNNPAVLAYELINEPFPGNIYSDPKLLLVAGYADQRLLAPLYQRIHEYIRTEDDETIIMFEPMVSSTEFVPRRTGFREGPGGEEYRNREVFAYHYYCDSHLETSDYCEWFIKTSMEKRQRDWRRMGIAGFLTEYGAFTGNLTADVAQMNQILEQTDKYLQSWTAWEYDYITASPEMDGTVSRSYPRAIAGTPTEFSFDPKTSDFFFSYISSNSTLPTEIFIREDTFYSNGFNIVIDPVTVRWEQPRQNIIHLIHGDLPLNQHVSVTITQK